MIEPTIGGEMYVLGWIAVIVVVVGFFLKWLWNILEGK